ncbi:hypothetical protein J437_LFUL002927 [Ladona fulva]|uniref:Cytohesin-1 n=1 Tax=Ladona fulva TaxID=123851 RepID=A0A8K0K9K2_LADFU|nr:hypothetical protein J437_LFUL002927 [Ladona fulva]
MSSTSSHSAEQFNINDLTPEQQKMLIDIRRRKTELLLEIQTKGLEAPGIRRQALGSTRRGAKRPLIKVSRLAVIDATCICIRILLNNGTLAILLYRMNSSEKRTRRKNALRSSADHGIIGGCSLPIPGGLNRRRQNGSSGRMVFLAEEAAKDTAAGIGGRLSLGTIGVEPQRCLLLSTGMTILQLKDELGEVVAKMENMDTADESKNNTRAKKMSIGRKKFNMDPKKGIEYLIEHGLLRETAADVAQFLHKGEGLNKTAIGDYLGERHEFNEKVLKAFVDLHDFTDLILVQALRQFLWSFRLPGEAQKIDRMMECFAQRYCQLNPNIFTNTDTCYVLSFAIIMLNTSLHNPSVKEKPTVEQFITMNRGINNGGDLPRELLVSLYDSIKTEPFKIPEDDGNDLMHTFFNPDKEGWLWKQGGRYKSWKRRWFILNDNCLYYFEYTTDKEPRGIIPLENIRVREVQDRHKPHCFELHATGTEFIKACKTDSEGKVVEEKDEWIKCVRQSISHNPFYDMLAARKKKAQKTSAHSKS